MAHLECVLIFVFLMLGIICFALNFLVCYVVYRYKSAIGAFGYFVFSLAITDMLVGAVCIPMYLTLLLTVPKPTLATPTINDPAGLTRQLDNDSKQNVISLNNNPINSTYHGMKLKNHPFTDAHHVINSKKRKYKRIIAPINSMQDMIEKKNHRINSTQDVIKMTTPSSPNHSINSTHRVTNSKNHPIRSTYRVINLENTPINSTQYVFNSTQRKRKLKDHATNSTQRNVKWTNHPIKPTTYKIFLKNHPINSSKQMLNLTNRSIKSRNHSSNSTRHPASVLSPIRKGIYISLNVLEVYLSACSIAHLCLMAFDRMLRATKPIFHRTKFSDTNFVIRLTLIPWVLSIAFAIITAISHTMSGTVGPVMLIFVIMIFLPFLFIFICYVIIFVTIRRRNRWFSKENGILAGINQVNKINEKRMIKMVSFIILMFLLCWLPVIVTNIVFPGYTTANGFGTEWKSRLGTISKFFHYSNSACNPLIYFFLCPIFKSRVKLLFSESTIWAAAASNDQ